MQFQADMLERPVLRSGAADVSAKGAAWLAGLSVGIWRSLEELAGLPRAEDQFHPRMAAGERARLYDGWREAVERTVGKG
jgi:glycerol kinase